MDKIKKPVLILFLLMSSFCFAEPIIGVDESALVKDVDMLLKLEENSKAQKFEEEISATKDPVKIEVIVDSSGSMGQILAKNKTKMFYLKKLMKEFFKARWKEKNIIGLRIYSGLTPNKCDDIRMVVPFSVTKIDKMETAVDALSPLGMTPLHKSLEVAFDDLKTFAGPKRVVVVTDGEDTCGGDPCKTVEEWKKQNLDLKFYVIALGFKGDSEAFKKIQCIGDTQVANDDQSFNDAVSQISNKISQKENLQVISPNPSASVYLFKIEDGVKTLFRVFYAYSSQTVPPGQYEAVVNLLPAYKFSEFTVTKTKKTVLKVFGDGLLTVNYFNQLVNVAVLDKNNKTIKQFRSDTPTEVPSGKWQLRIFKNPFFEVLIPEYYIYPMGKHEYNIVGAGALKVINPELSGIYLYDQNNKDLGQFLSNSTIVLKSGVYTFHKDNKCTFPDIQIKDKKEILVLSCPQK